MRRATAAILGTLAGAALLTGAKLGAPSQQTANAGNVSAADPAAALGGDDGSAAPSAGTAGSAPAPASAGPSGSAKTSATPKPGGTTGAPKPPPTTGAPACATKTGSASNISGPGIGAVTVAIKVCGGVVTAASAGQDQSNWSNDCPITSTMSKLSSLVPANYKSNISAIHVASCTLTSNAYQTSLKSALAKAGL